MDAGHRHQGPDQPGLLGRGEHPVALPQCDEAVEQGTQQDAAADRRVGHVMVVGEGRRTQRGIGTLGIAENQFDGGLLDREEGPELDGLGGRTGQLRGPPRGREVQGVGGQDASCDVLAEVGHVRRPALPVLVLPEPAQPGLGHLEVALHGGQHRGVPSGLGPGEVETGRFPSLRPGAAVGRHRRRELPHQGLGDPAVQRELAGTDPDSRADLGAVPQGGDPALDEGTDLLGPGEVSRSPHTDDEDPAVADEIVDARGGLDRLGAVLAHPGAGGHQAVLLAFAAGPGGQVPAHDGGVEQDRVREDLLAVQT
ncbi:hypothetical protein BWX38_12785 [Acidipropionibacterium acidipropionici]|nr:hypothetical protein BWX38_12785 [Acidipropionibacterium acidipropionici]